MEAPEKIYLYPSDRASEEYETEWGDKPWGEDYVEYTRTDVIVEKACVLLVNSIEDFMLRRMEIWDKDCKKQTLENIRKALKE